MTDYLKDKFSPWLKKWKEGVRKSNKSFVDDFMNQKETNDKILQKINAALTHTYKKYENLDMDFMTKGAKHTNADKDSIKSNMRKRDLYYKAIIFGTELFEFGKLTELMTHHQLLEFASMILSIVLSHQYQKEDITNIT